MESMKEKAVNRKIAEIYGTFHLDQSEFTLGVESIQEVVNYPERVTCVPLAPSFLLGIFNLRGIIVPIIDMRSLLDFPKHEAVSGRKVAIVDFQGVRVGLVFDSTGEILHVQSHQRSDFEYVENSRHRAVRGALKLDGGNRIVQVLDPEALLRIENLPQILEKVAAGNPRQDREAGLRGPRKQCIAFMAGKTKFAVEINAIHEIIRVPEMQPSIVADRNCLGMANLRGLTLPIVDFVEYLGFRADSPRQGTNERVIILRMGEAKLGLLIDSVDNIASYYGDDVLPIPMLGKERTEMFAGLISRAGLSDMILLKAEGVFADEGLRDIADGHHKLFGAAHGTQAAETKRKGKRRVCIAFHLERNFAFPIQEIREIIHYSEDTIRHPGLPEQIRGVLNLRGQVVTIVDLRALYALSPFSDPKQAKVIIVERDGAKYGLLVDSVEDIVSFFEDQTLPLPRTLVRGDGQDSFQSEIKEMLELPMPGGEPNRKRALIILDLEKILGRIENVLGAVA